MRWRDQLYQASLNLGAAKLRSVLAILGILVGTAAVVALISSGELATEKALEQFKSLGTDLMAVTVYQQQQGQSTNKPPYPTVADWRRIPELLPDVEDIAPYVTAYQHMSFGGKPIKGVIIGADESLARLIKIDLAEGHFVSFVASYEHDCVIGAGVAKAMQQTTMDSPIGKQIQLGQQLYTIIGVARHWDENAFFNEDINQAVIIPIGGILVLAKDAHLSNAVLKIKPDSAINPLIAKIKELLMRQFPGINVFSRSAKQIIASMESQGQIFTLLLGVIGGISLLVGGIGVMNVMLVSVTERRREIGIRKAVGARKKDIRTLFLTESVLLALLGGSLGVCVGLIFTLIAAWFSDWPFHIYLLPPLAGFAVSALTGIFFGYYPAHRAASLDAVVSLRDGV